MPRILVFAVASLGWLASLFGAERAAQELIRQLGSSSFLEHEQATVGPQQSDKEIARALAACIAAAF